MLPARLIGLVVSGALIVMPAVYEDAGVAGLVAIGFAVVAVVTWVVTWDRYDQAMYTLRQMAGEVAWWRQQDTALRRVLDQKDAENSRLRHALERPKAPGDREAGETHARSGADASQGDLAQAVLVHVGRRQHALVSRTLQVLTALERGVEDPDLLHELFRIDHLVTRTRREAERVAVLGGETSRKTLKPLLLSTVLRQAVAEVEYYPRVRVVLPGYEMAVPGHAGPDVIHLLAELIENATRFSEAGVLVRTEEVPAGLAVEVQDQGLTMSPERLAAMNRVLASPQEGSSALHAGLRERHIGLLVVARLARRHGIQVQLWPNNPGTRAQVVLPRTVLVAPKPQQAGQVTADEQAAGDVHVPRVPPCGKDAPEPSSSPSPASANSSRPALPRRSAAPRRPAGQPQAGGSSARQGAAAPKPPTPDLWADFTDGTRQAPAEDTTQAHDHGSTPG
ncbi:sensor histidine kinase [Actinomadura viridis]|uniref:sensor histidine kinase n=1 Tax=Actinomadura viridis TaxID=58110 RepID=UPI003688226A